MTFVPKKCVLKGCVDLSPDTKASHKVFMKAQGNCKKHTAELEKLWGENKLQKKTQIKLKQYARSWEEDSNQHQNLKDQVDPMVAFNKC